MDDWRLRAVCRRVDPDLFSTEGATTRAEARHICVRHCPVLRECLDWAREVPPSYVVMGGLSWGQDGKPNRRSQPLSSRCRLCGPGFTPEDVRRVEADIAEYSQTHTDPEATSGLCGTWAGYLRHMREDTGVCEVCRLAQQAHAQLDRARMLAKRAAAGVS